MCLELLKIYELTVFIYIALLAAVATIYVIVLTFLNRLIKSKKEEVGRLKTEAEEKTKQIRDELSKTCATSDDNGVLLEKLKKWEDQLSLVERQAQKREQIFERFSFNSTFIKPNLFIFSSITLIFIAIAMNTRLLISSILYIISWVVIGFSILKYVLPVLKEVDILAQEQTETPIETLNRIIREQTEETRTELQKTYKEMIDKFDSLIDSLKLSYQLKPPLFGITFYQKGIKKKSLNLSQNNEEIVTIVFENNSEYVLHDADLVIILPKHFTLKKSIEDKTHYRISEVAYPEYAELVIPLTTCKPNVVVKANVFIKATKSGRYKMIVWVASNSHKRFEKTIQVIVKAVTTKQIETGS